jgi:nucleoside-diphosphate-sugar epimerase
MSRGVATVLGSGLIARAFKNVEFTRETLVLASGVSNSIETRMSEFHREASTVRNALTKYKGMHVIYFSTSSVTAKVKSPYISHKLEMENLILSKAACCNIFRLPQVVGVVQNYTLISYFTKMLLNGSKINLYAQATRDLLSILDVVRVVHLVVNKNFSENAPLSVGSGISIPVAAILLEISMLLNRCPKVRILNEGTVEQAYTSAIRQFLGEDDRIFKQDYWLTVLRYYVPLIAANIKTS